MDLNHLNAKLIKAEIMGDTEMVNQYKKQIEEFQSKKEKESKSLEDLNEYNDKLNYLNAKLIKAEIMGDQDTIDDYKKKIENMKKNFENKKKNFEEKEEKIIEKPKKQQNSVLEKYENREKLSKKKSDEKHNSSRSNVSHQPDNIIDKNPEMSLRDKKKELLKELEKKGKDYETKLGNLNNSLMREEMKVNLDKCKVIKKELKELNTNYLANKKKIKDLKEELEIKKEKMYFDPEKRVNPDFKFPDYEKEESNKKSYKTIQILRKFSEDNLSLKQMFVSEKNSSSADDNKRYFQTSSKIKIEQDEYEDIKCKKIKKENDFVYQEINDDEVCNLCLTKTKKHLLIDYNDKIMLVMPEKQPLMDQQLVIRSNSHCSSLVLANEDIIDAIESMKSKMSSLFDTINHKVIFVEYYFKNTQRWKRHFELICFPIKSKNFDQSKMYFKKSIMESEEEWSINKKIVILNGKPLDKMIPKGLPYFCVTFGSKNDGFAHVIEDERKFPKHFAEEVIGGMLNIEPFRWLNPKHIDYDKQKKRQTNLKSFWKKFDITSR